MCLISYFPSPIPYSKFYILLLLIHHRPTSTAAARHPPPHRSTLPFILFSALEHFGATRCGCSCSCSTKPLSGIIYSSLSPSVAGLTARHTSPHIRHPRSPQDNCTKWHVYTSFYYSQCQPSSSTTPVSYNRRPWLTCPPASLPRPFNHPHSIVNGTVRKQ